MNPARLARVLVALFLRSFRNEYGGDLSHLFLERWRDAGTIGRKLALAFDLLTSAGREWRTSLAERNDNPRRRLDVLLLDLKHQIRWLARTPAFALSALLTLGVGIGITTAIFAVFNGVLLRPLPFPDAERLSFITRSGDVSLPDGVDWRARGRAWESIALFARSWSFDLTGIGDPEPVTAVAAESEFFRVLQIEPILGRRFGPEDDRPGGPHVLLITEAFWRARFAADRAVIGRQLTLSGNPTTIIGVLPSPVDFLDTGIIGVVPIGVELPWAIAERGTNNLDAIGRIRPGVAFEDARRELTRISTDLTTEYPRTNRGKVVDPLPLATFITGDVRPALIVVLAAVAVLLLIATVNLAGLLLARVTARRRELALRSALGAAHGRLTRQLVTEGVSLGAVGGGLGLVVAAVALAILRGALPDRVPRTGTLELSGGVLFFALGLTVLAGLVCGLVPALTRRVASGLGDLGSARGANERGRHRALRTVVASEVALAVALLAAAGIVGKSFGKLWHQSLGFEPEGLLTANLVLPEGRFGDRAAQTRAFSAVVDRLRATPGVTQAAYVTNLPLDRRGGIGSFVLFEGRDFPPDRRTGARVRAVYGDYFSAMRIPILKGRSISEADRDGTVPVAVVNQTFARTYFDGIDPVGRRIALRDWHDDTPGPVWMTIVGVATDIRSVSLADGDEPAIYMPYVQRQVGWQRFGNLVVRTAGEPDRFVPEFKAAIWTVDGLLAPADIQTLTERRRGSVARERFLAVVLALFAISAVALVIQGLWGVVSYAVAERRKEIGVRVALGAAGGNVVGLVTREAVVPVAVGAAAGLLLAVIGSRLLAGAVFQVSPTDPGILGLTVGGLFLVAILASAVPAWRATRIDPLEAMRAE